MDEIVKITFVRESVEAETRRGTQLSDVMRGAGIPLEMPCNGMGVCGKCLVRVRGKSDEKSVQACTFLVMEDVRVLTPPPKGESLPVDRGRRVEFEADGGVVGTGVAVDLGTTVFSVCLVSGAGETLAKASCLNPQTEYSGDVLTRAGWCRGRPDHLEKLRRLAVEALNGLIDDMLASATADRNTIHRVAVAGNTVMQHIFAGVDPTPLTHFPFRPVFEGPLDVPVRDLRVGSDVRVSLLPCISAFIGGDIVAGVIASGFASTEKNGLFIDIGTNGEIVLRLNGKMYGTSTAAGPALEGMNISCGVRAVPGAVERAFVDERGELAFRTIGNEPPVGICGSGLIDLTAALLRMGILDETGFLKGCPGGKYHLTEDIFLSQKDFRQIQLAKGAIAAGIKILLEAAGGVYGTLDSVDIAGAFGFHLNFESLRAIGLIDEAFQGEVRFAGNTSLEGATLWLLSRKIRDEMVSVARLIEPVELSGRTDFQNAFVRELNFPR
ncbi:MAG: ASKHA domain-containing protein [Synergistaceae bacterium]|jgi:uncharacterized 2Fe-2S/4Fe-4S cluster protein (DUF4445 family)|nr:ASKHA domain-containing protein [Synergistaceae bacterium]